jgi:hypothetical protein
MLSFPGRHLAHPLRGCRLPDAILHGKRSLLGLIAGPSSVLRPLNYRVRPLSSLGLVVAATGLRTRLRHACDAFFASPPFSSGTATVFDGALARGHGSDLLTLRLPFAHKPAVSFVTSPAFRKFFTSFAQAPCSSRRARSLCSPFGVFRLADLLAKTARVARSVLTHSSNHIPSG